MALKLTKGKPTSRAVDLDGCVTLWLRPATYPESIEAAERIAPQIVALREGSAAAAELAPLLGEEFTQARLDDAALGAAAHRLALIELMVLCSDRIDGTLLGDDDQPITSVDQAIAALILRDGVLARRVREVIEGPLYEVIAEKNGSAASPDGAAAIPDTAPDAVKPAPLVH